MPAHPFTHARARIHTHTESPTSQRSQFDAGADEIIEGNPAADAEAPHHHIHGLWAQIVTWRQTDTGGAVTV